jgi:hypothetical protein
MYFIVVNGTREKMLGKKFIQTKLNKGDSK